MTLEFYHLETPYLSSLNRPILQGINCCIKPGEFVGLLGLNGAGKSTLLRSLIGLVPVQTGEIKINGVTLNKRSLSRIRHEVGMIFQGGGLIRQLSALDNVLCGLLGVLSPWKTLWGFSKGDRRLAIDLLTRLGLKDHIYQKTGNLSGGQQQRVAIARALIQSPQILLADEPTAGLDIMAAQQVMDILSKLHRNEGMTVVTVLHDIGMASSYCERVIVLNAGCIVYDGDCQNLQSRFAELSKLST